MTLNTLLNKNLAGISFKRNGDNYIPAHFKAGYFVSLTNNEIIDQDRLDIIGEIERLAFILSLKNFFFGYWKDNETEKEYLDLSLHKTSKQEAIILARQFNQRAIFDCYKLNSIYI